MIANANGIALFYETLGDGPPLLLLHGNGQDHRIFDALAPKLAILYAVYALDSRNHGQSQKTDEYSYDAMAEDAYAFIQALRLERVRVVGFSDGAIIALKLAMKHGDAVERMALLGVNLRPEDFTEKSLLYLRARYEETGDPLVKLMLTEPHIGLDEVRRLMTPVLLIAAEREIYKPETFTGLAEALSHAELKIMPGHNHESYIVNQDILYPDFAAFFR